MSMNDNEREIKIALVNLHLEKYKEILALLPAIREVIRKYDGKTFSKRLSTAMKKINPCLFCFLESSSFKIVYCPDSREVYGVPDKNSVIPAYYISEHTINIIWGSSHGNKYEKACIPNNVINAEVICALLDIEEKNFEKIIITTKAQLEKLDELEEKRRVLMRELEDFNNSINWMMDNYFNLSIHV